MSDVAIKVEGLSKAYRLGTEAERSDTLVGAACNMLAAPLRNFRRLYRLNTFATDRDAEDILWALKDVSFEIREGEVVGFVGRNGAGKSTLLKILSRITEPTAGRITMRGRVSSLLEVGTGFHPELTGRENIYMNGTILGMKKAEIDRKFDEIVEFSGVERFLDTPVKRYSSGMKVRLAFSVAAHLEPELLIVDEVLAVGDAEFQKKCLGKMQDVAGGGRTVLFVSHNMVAIADLCTRGVFLDAGRVVYSGPTAEAIDEYLTRFTRKSANPVDFGAEGFDRTGHGRIRLVSAMMSDASGTPATTFGHGETINVSFVMASPTTARCSASLAIRNRVGQLVLHLPSLDEVPPLWVGPTPTRIEVRVPANPLNNGEYFLSITLLDHAKAVSDQVQNGLSFEITNRFKKHVYCNAAVRTPAEWHVVEHVQN